MKPESQATLLLKPGNHYDVRIYQSTHTTGGAIMGTNPANSVINRYSQSWDLPNLFIYGASAFPQNVGYNPTGLLAAPRLFLCGQTQEFLPEIPRTLGFPHEGEDLTSACWRRHHKPWLQQWRSLIWVTRLPERMFHSYPRAMRI